MYHSKKIALFISHIYGEYQKNVCQGVVDRAQDYGFQVEIYATSDGEDVGRYGLGESSLLRIPNFEDISGIIIASDTYPQKALKDRIIALVREKSTCAIVEITEVPSEYPSISLENNLPAGALTEHLISVHNYQNLCYLGCSSEQFFSDRREKAFRNICKQHAIDVQEQQIYLSDYSPSSIHNAWESFCMYNQPHPDAIVCYNDRMALLMMAEILQAGYRVPEDVAIVGCDYSPEGQNTEPSLTTITFPVYQLGTEAMDHLIRTMRGITCDRRSIVFAQPVIGHSCGCSCKAGANPIFYGMELVQRIRELESSTFSSTHMFSNFSHITDIESGVDLLEQYVSQLEHCTEFYLCLYPDWDALSQPLQELTGEPPYDCDTDHIILQLPVRNGTRLPKCTFSKHSLLPDFISSHSDSTYLVLPLYFETREFGYVVMAYEDNKIDFHFHLVQWIVNITYLLQNICNARSSQIMQEKLIDLYMRDPLTALYNRQGFEKKAEELLSATPSGAIITLYIFDMDHLKQINDVQGHLEGDFALRIIGQALQQCAPEDMLCCRFGGDEFCMLSNSLSEADAKDYMHRVDRYLSNYNALNSRPYQVSVSMGCCRREFTSSMTPETLQDMIQVADQEMYHNKRAKHAARP